MPGLALRLLLAIALLQLAGCAYLYRYESISEQPQRDGADQSMQPRLSTIQPSLNIPLAALQGAANAAAGTVLPFNDDGRARVASLEIMKPWPFSGCWICEYLDVDWKYTVSPPSPIQVAGRNNELVVAVPAALGGQAGFNGEIAKWLSLRAKNFGAALEINFKTGLLADANFCPSLSGVSLDYRWITPPYIELVGPGNCVFGYCINPWRLDLQGEIDPVLKPKVQGVASGLQQNIPCDPVRRRFRPSTTPSRHWRNRRSTDKGSLPLRLWVMWRSPRRGWSCTPPRTVDNSPSEFRWPSSSNISSS